MNILNFLNQGAFYFLLIRAVILIIVATYILYQKGRNSDAGPNLICGVMCYFFSKYIESGITLTLMFFIYSFAVFEIAISWWLVIFTILSADLAFYFYHRLAHKYRLLWADHSAHHSSCEYDLTTNLRNSFLNDFYCWFPLIPLLLLGVSPVLIQWSRALVNDYTFFIHTTKIKHIGPFEWVMNSPSHHRVHHATNEEYIDKNFGAMFIIWDRLFGTFAEEKNNCQFGARNSSYSKNPIKILFNEWHLLIQDLYRASGFTTKIKVLLKSYS